MVRRWQGSGWFAMALLAGVLSWSGCGVKSTQSTSTVAPPDPPGSTTVTPILLTLTDDASSNGLVSFYANIAQVQITPRQGSASTLYTSSSTVEITHLAGSAKYLTMTGIAPNSYTKINVTVTDPLITYIDALGSPSPRSFPASPVQRKSISRNC